MMEANNSKYTQFLPRIYQKRSDETDSEYFLGRFLKAFEDILTGNSDEKIYMFGIEQILDRFDQYIDPYQTPAQFLSWLAGWVGLQLEESIEFYGEKDIQDKNKRFNQILPLNNKRQSINRRMIGSEVQSYKRLGTNEGLLRHLQVYAGEEAIITMDEFEEQTQIGKVGRIGIGTVVGHGRPYFFSVHVIIPAPNKAILEKKKKIIRRIIEREKPIYTNYILTTEIPVMRIGTYSRVGKTTLVGGMTE